jgi:hypothetical protein
MEIVSTDAHAGVAVTIYKSGSLTAYILAANETITISDIVFVSTAGGTYDLIFGTAASYAEGVGGTRIAKGNASALGGLTHHFSVGVAGPAGYLPYLYAAAGQVDLVLQGFINET